MSINEALRQKFIDFISNVPARRLKDSTTKLLLYFFKFEYTDELSDFKDPLLTDLLFLFDLLDTIDKEIDQSSLK
jgi:hypothetical protein